MAIPVRRACSKGAYRQHCAPLVKDCVVVIKRRVVSLTFPFHPALADVDSGELYTAVTSSHAFARAIRRCTSHVKQTNNTATSTYIFTALAAVV